MGAAGAGTGQEVRLRLLLHGVSCWGEFLSQPEKEAGEDSVGCLDLFLSLTIMQHVRSEGEQKEGIAEVKQCELTICDVFIPLPLRLWCP